VTPTSRKVRGTQLPGGGRGRSKPGLSGKKPTHAGNNIRYHEYRGVREGVKNHKKKLPRNIVTNGKLGRGKGGGKRIVGFR